MDLTRRQSESGFVHSRPFFFTRHTRRSQECVFGLQKSLSELVTTSSLRGPNLIVEGNLSGC